MMLNNYLRLAEEAETVARVVSLKEEKVKLLLEARRYREHAASLAARGHSKRAS